MKRLIIESNIPGIIIVYPFVFLPASMRAQPFLQRALDLLGIGVLSRLGTRNADVNGETIRVSGP